MGGASAEGARSDGEPEGLAGSVAVVRASLRLAARTHN